MASERNASILLFTLLATIVLFAILAVAGNTKAFEEHAYMPGFGWVEPNVDNPHNIIDGSCEPSTLMSGFPIATTRQAMPNNCLKDTNLIAASMNYAIYFAAAAIISVGAVGVVRDRL
jgi:hypothetical protein